MGDESTPSIREVLEEAAGKTAVAGKADPASTEHPASDDAGKEPSSTLTPKGDGKEEELESVDPALQDKVKQSIAKLSPEEQREVLGNLKNYDRHFHKQMQKVSEFRRFAEGLVQRFPGLTVSELEEALTTKRTMPASTPSKKESKESEMTDEDIDALIEKASDPAIREELRKSKQVLHREMDKRFEAKLKPIQDELERLRQTTTTSRAASIDGEIDSLEDADGFSNSFIEKYRGNIRAYALKWNLPAKEVLPKIVPFDELREAFAARTTKTNTAQSTKTQPVRTVSAASAAGNDLERFKETRGGWNVKGALRALLPKGG